MLKSNRKVSWNTIINQIDITSLLSSHCYRNNVIKQNGIHEFPTTTTKESIWLYETVVSVRIISPPIHWKKKKIFLVMFSWRKGSTSNSLDGSLWSIISMGAVETKKTKKKNEAMMMMMFFFFGSFLSMDPWDFFFYLFIYFLAHT